jgi:dTMP kinase
LLITFEGIDGAGKSSHIQSVANAFKQAGHCVTLTREPGGTALAEQLRELVLHQPMDALSEALIMFAARRDHIQTLIEPALRQGHVVLSDRFTDATFAYQGGGRLFDWQVLQQLEQWVQVRPPDATFWFDLPPAVAAQRLQAARTPDRFESEALPFFERVVQGYARRAQEDANRFIRIDANQTFDAVASQVAQALQQRWPQHFSPNMVTPHAT